MPIKKYTPEESAKIIRKVAKEMGVDGCFMVAKANIESKLNNKAKNGPYAGLFQLSDGVGGCKGDDRFDPEKSTKAAIRYIRSNREAVEPKLAAKNLKWEDWMAYLAHQQGAGGAAYILTNPGIAIADSSKKKAIKSNSPKGFKGKTHKDFANYWRDTFYNLQNQCAIDMANCAETASGSGMSDLATGACKMCLDTDAPSPYRNKEELNTMLLIGGLAMVAGGAYALMGTKKRKLKRG